MLQTRLWMGACLIILTVAMLVVDQWLGPWYPFLLLFFLVLSTLACRELVLLLGRGRLAPPWFCLVAVALVLLANWPAHQWAIPVTSFELVLLTFAAVLLAGFVFELARFREPGGAIDRLARLTWLTAYLGVLPSFLAQLRWLAGRHAEWRGIAAVSLALFVPKLCDIGAYLPVECWGGTA